MYEAVVQKWRKSKKKTSPRLNILLTDPLIFEIKWVLRENKFIIESEEIGVHDCSWSKNNQRVEVETLFERGAIQLPSHGNYAYHVI